MMSIVRSSFVLLTFAMLLLFAPHHALHSEQNGTTVAEDEGSSEPREPVAPPQELNLWGTVPATLLIEEAAEHTGATFVYDPTQLRNRGVHVTGEIEAPETNEEWFALLGELLWQIGFTYVRLSETQPRYRVLPVQSAGQQIGMPVSDPAELPYDEYMGCLIVHLKYADANSMQRALLNILTRPGGVIVPIHGSNALMIVDSRLQLKRIHRAVQLLDRIPHEEEQQDESEREVDSE